MKLDNFASLDPVLRARRIRGLPNVSEADRQIWAEFHDNIKVLAPQSEQLLHELITKDDQSEVDLMHPEGVRLEQSFSLPKDYGETESRALVKVRRGQQFFRQSILSAYGVRCCISGINVPELLVASHIRPWRDFPNERLSPSNGLCLSSLHDRAFDTGLITVDREFRLVLSARLQDYFPQPALQRNFGPFQGKKIQLPKKWAAPSQDYLDYHREILFQR